jgi:anaerobic selenocysteine-containing dehydrogenase
MKVTRRDLLFWGVGATAGLMATPVPWKVLDDVSIWSQNWPWIPQPARGPVEVKQSFCTLCPNGCGLRVRMASGFPVGLSGVKTHPNTNGSLCPLGFGAHQLLWHPQRLRTVRHRGNPSNWTEAQAAFAKACIEGPIAVVDGYPGRAASSLIESFARKQGGTYRVVCAVESRALSPYQTWNGIPARDLGYDLEHAQTILSFGAPLLDGWGTPGRFARLWADRAAGLANPQLRLIQIETTFSRTAARAWRWMQIREGSESALASGVAQVLLEQSLVPAQGPVPQVSLIDVAAETRLSTDAIRDLAYALVERRPAVVIARDENPAIAALNVLLGAVGTRGGIVRRSSSVQSKISDESALPKPRAVVVDASAPWDFTPEPGTEIFRFAAWDSGTTPVDWLLPAPAFLEDLTDVPSAPTSAVETSAVAPTLIKPPADLLSAAQFLANADSNLVPVDKIIHSRCDEIFRKRSGNICGQETHPVSQFPTLQKLEEELWQGAVWVGEPSTPVNLRCELTEWPTATPISPTETWTTEWPVPVLPPLASKLYIESALREAPGRTA